MADNFETNSASGGEVFASDDIAGVQYPILKLALGALDSATLLAGGAGNVSAGVPRVTLAADDPAVVDLAAIEALLTTIDGDTGTIAGAVSGSEMQVDVVAALPAGNNNIGDVDVASLPSTVHSADFDTGGGTDTTLAFGIAVPASGGAVVVPGDATAGLKVDLGADNDVTVTGTVDLGATDNAVLDAIAASVAAIDTDATTIIGHLDGVETLLGTIDADTSTLAGAVAGSEMQVDVVTMPTVTVNAHDVTNAGTFAVQVDGAALTALQLLDDTVFAEDVAASAADKGIQVLAVRRDADTTLVDTTNDYAPLQVDARGALKVEAFSGETLPVSLASVPSHAVTNAGTFAVQVDGSALTALQLIDDPVVQDDAGFTPGTTKVMMAGFEADESSTDSVDEGDGGAARMTLDRKQIVTTYPHTAGGLSTFNATSSDGATALTSTAQGVKGSAGQLYGYYCYNPNATAQFVQFYNTASGSVTVGTTNPLFMLTIPPTSAANLMMPFGVAFGTAIAIAATSTAGGNGAPGTALDVVVWYA